MKSSGSIIRGHLRPIGARSPPFLLIGLLVVLGILGFNYWNLSYEYDGIIKEIADLQDHLRMAVLKKENADKQSEALEKRFREAEHQLSKVKITADLNHRELTELEQKLEAKNTQLQSVKTQLETCQSSNAKLNSTLDSVGDLQKKNDQLETEKSELRHINEELSAINEKMRSTVDNLEKRISIIQAEQSAPVIDPFRKIPAASAPGHNLHQTGTTSTSAIKDGGMPQPDPISPEKTDKTESKSGPAAQTPPPQINLSEEVKEVQEEVAPLPVNEETTKNQTENNEVNGVEQTQPEGGGAGYGDENEIAQWGPAGNKMEVKDAKNLVQNEVNASKEANASQIGVQTENKNNIPPEEKVLEKAEGILQPPTKISDDKAIVNEDKDGEDEPIPLNPNIPKPNAPESNLV